MDTSINHYLDLVAVKQELGIATGDAGVDHILTRQIGLASRYFDDYCDRTFYSQVATRKFRAATSRILFVGDLLSVTSMTINGVGVQLSDYELRPLNDDPKREVYLVSGAFCRDDLVEITGLWGHSDLWLESEETVTCDGTTKNLTVGVAGFSASMTIKVEDEQMFVQRVDQASILVRRGLNGTVAASHSDKPVCIRMFPAGLAKATMIQVTRWYRGKDASFNDEVGTDENRLRFAQSMFSEVKGLLGKLKPASEGMFHA